MKPLKAKSANMAVQSDGNARRTDFKIGVSEAAMIKYLTSLYSDKYRAVVSEIASNAMDEVLLALAEKRTIKPYEISLPSEEDPYLRITDFGRGMDRDFLFNQATTYGLSTKNEDNTALGGKGIGLKSPLCLGPFTIESVKDGKLTTVAMVPDGGDGIPECIETHHGPTKRPNGTSVVIPAGMRERNDFLRACKEFLHFMPQSVRPNVIGAEITYFWDNPGATDLRKHKIPIIYDMNNTRNRSELTFVIGYRPYTVRREALPEDVRTAHDVIQRFIPAPVYIFPIGYLSISDNRETVDLDKPTIERLEKHFQNTKDRLIKHFEDQLHTTKDLERANEAVQVLNRGLGQRKTYPWKFPSGTEVELNGSGFEIKTLMEKLYGRESFIVKKKEKDRWNNVRETEVYIRTTWCRINVSKNERSRHGFSFGSEDTAPTWTVPPYLNGSKPINTYYLDDKKKTMPLFWAPVGKVKAWRNRVLYYLSEAGRKDLGHGLDFSQCSYNSFVYVFHSIDPRKLAAKFPELYHVVDLSTIKVPAPKKVTFNSSNFVEKMINEGSAYYAARYITADHKTRNKSDHYIVSGKFDLKKNKIHQVYYVPIVNQGHIGIVHNKKPLGGGHAWRNAITDVIHTMIDLGALRKNDLIVFVQKAIFDSKQFQEAIANRDVLPFIRHYRKTIKRSKTLREVVTKPVPDSRKFGKDLRALDEISHIMSRYGQSELAKQANDRKEALRVYMKEHEIPPSFKSKAWLADYLDKCKTWVKVHQSVPMEYPDPKEFIQKYSICCDYGKLITYYLANEASKTPATPTKGKGSK